MMEDTMSNNQKLQTILLLVLVFALSVVAVVYTSDHPAAIEAFVRQVGAFGPVLVVGLYAALGASPIPSEALSLINGAVYGPVLGTALGFTGNMISALIEYWIGTRISSVADFEDRRQHLPLGLGRFPADSVWFLLFGRLVPGYGGKLVSVVGGIYRVPMLKYLWTAAIPTFIGTMLFVVGGYGLLNVIH